MIRPLLQDDALLADIRAARTQTHQLHLWWLGQSGFLIQWQNRHLLLDPYLSDSLTRKYAETDKPHVRMTERVIAPERLDFIDVVTSSHNHTDHLDAETLAPLFRANPQLTLIIPEANRAFVAERLGMPGDQFIGLDDGKAADASGFRLRGIPAAHETVERDEAGRCRYLGYRIQAGPWHLFHPGDTVLYDGLVDRLREPKLTLALLPINGRTPERRVAGNLDGAEAARLAHSARASLVVPCHFEMFEFNTASPALFTSECERLRQPCRLLRCGERFSWPS
jgi:L-ascorbate metabolism protein UlaG (beta-lactamase superfamily)